MLNNKYFEKHCDEVHKEDDIKTSAELDADHNWEVFEDIKVETEEIRIKIRIECLIQI